MKAPAPGPAVFGSLAALVAAGPILAVAWIAVSAPWGDYLLHLLQTRLPGYVLNTLIVTSTAMMPCPPARRIRRVCRRPPLV